MAGALKKSKALQSNQFPFRADALDPRGKIELHLSQVMQPLPQDVAKVAFLRFPAGVAALHSNQLGSTR